MATERSDSRPDGASHLRRVRRKAALFGPILVIVAAVVTALGVPWQLTAGALALFLVWLIIEG